MGISSPDVVASAAIGSAWQKATIAGPSKLEAWAEIRQAFNQQVQKYLEYKGVEPFYAVASLLHILSDTKKFQDLQSQHFAGQLAPEVLSTMQSEIAIRELLQSAFAGKTVVELGCRGASYLKLIKAHGAKEVLGVTGSFYAAAARESIGSDSVIVANVSELTPRQILILKNTKPDIVISTNLLEESRSEANQETKPKMLNLLQRLGALNYIVPAVNSRSLLTSADFIPLKHIGGSVQGVSVGSGTCYIARHFNVMGPVGTKHSEIHRLKASEEALLTGCSYRFKLEEIDYGRWTRQGEMT